MGGTRVCSFLVHNLLRDRLGGKVEEEGNWRLRLDSTESLRPQDCLPRQHGQDRSQARLPEPPPMQCTELKVKETGLGASAVVPPHRPAGPLPPCPALPRVPEYFQNLKWIRIISTAPSPPSHLNLEIKLLHLGMAHPSTAQTHQPWQEPGSRREGTFPGHGAPLWWFDIWSQTSPGKPGWNTGTWLVP